MFTYPLGSSRRSKATAINTFGTILLGTYPTLNVCCHRSEGYPPIRVLSFVCVDNYKHIKKRFVGSFHVRMQFYLNETKWKLNISATICTFIPYLSPIFNHFRKRTSIGKITDITFTYMKRKPKLNIYHITMP